MKTTLKIFIEKRAKGDMMPMLSFKTLQMKIFQILFSVVFFCLGSLTAYAQVGPDQFNGDFFANFQGATGVKIQAYKVPFGVTNDIGVAVAGNLLDFGDLKKVTLPTNQVLYLPGDAPGQAQYFQIFITLIPAFSMAQQMHVSFQYHDLNNPNTSNFGGHGLGYKTSVFFRKQILSFEPDSPCHETPIGARVQLLKQPHFYYEPVARHALQTINQTGVNLYDFCHDMMMYLIINDLNPDFKWYGPGGLGNSEVFSPADKGGEYTGELTITATVL